MGADVAACVGDVARHGDDLEGVLAVEEQAKAAAHDAWSSAITILVIAAKLAGARRTVGGSRHQGTCGKLRTRRRPPPVADPAARS